jgi:RNA recognition motif-containing protein
LKKVYVGNLSRQTTEQELEAAFATFGRVDDVKIISDRFTGESRGFGFVEMQNDQEALAAINGLNGKELGGRVLTVNEAKPQERRPGGGGGGGGRGGPRGGGGGRGGGRGGWR